MDTSGSDSSQEGVSPTECLLVTEATIWKQQERSDVFLERETRSMYRKQQEEATDAPFSNNCWCRTPCRHSLRWFLQCRQRRREARQRRREAQTRRANLQVQRRQERQVRRTNIQIQQQGDRPQIEDEEWQEEEEQTPADNILERE